MSRKYCNGICIMGSDLIEGARGVAYAHPECELHSGFVMAEQCESADDRNHQCNQIEGHDPPCTFGQWADEPDDPPVITERPPEDAPF